MITVDIVNNAYKWCCDSRKHHHPDCDIWDFRYRWDVERKKIMNDLNQGSFKFDVQDRIRLKCGQEIDLFSAKDALVLKIVTFIIAEILHPVLSRFCYHIKGYGGLKGAIKEVRKSTDKYKYVFRTDVKSYYDSIDHIKLISKLQDYVHDKNIISLVWQFLRRCVVCNGIYRDIKKGIPMGSSLSPLLGAFYLRELDFAMEKEGFCYFRYMDDILVLSPSRWKLRNAVRIVNEILNSLELSKHPDKTFTGKIEKGFDFLGYHFGPEGLSLAKKTIKNFINKALRLYEQEPFQTRDKRLGEYVRRWFRWGRDIKLSILCAYS